MKTTLLLTALLTLAALTPSFAAVTGRSADSSLAGTEKLLSDSSGTDTYILVSTIWAAPTLTGGLTATGSTAYDYSGSTGAFKTSTGLNTFGGSGHAFASILYPSTNDGAALGDATHNFSDLFLASGAVININNTNWVATHTSGILTVGTGDLRVTTAGTNTASVVTVGGTQTLTAKTLTSPVIGTGLTASGSASNDFSASTGTFKTSTGVNTFGGSTHTFAGDAKPATDGTGNLGTAALSWDNLYLDTAATINFDNGNAVLTHSSGILTMGTGELRITTAGTNAASVPTLGSTSTLTNKTLTSPVIGTGLTASGSASNDFSGSTGTFKTSTGVNTFGGSSHTFAASIIPATDGTGDIGDATHGWDNLFLKTGGTIKFESTDWVATHSTGLLTVGTGNIIISTAGTAAGSVVTNNGTQTLTAKTLTAPVLNGAKVTPNVETITGDGAITIQSGTVLLTKGSAAAITLAAPSSQDGTTITITSTTAFAHVITVTGGMWDGTATTNTTATFPVVQGGAITLIAFGTDWYVLNLQGVVCAP